MWTEPHAYGHLGFQHSPWNQCSLQVWGLSVHSLPNDIYSHTHRLEGPWEPPLRVSSSEDKTSSLDGKHFTRRSYGLFLVFFETRFLCAALTPLNLLCRPGWPGPQISTCHCFSRVWIRVMLYHVCFRAIVWASPILWKVYYRGLNHFHQSKEFIVVIYQMIIERFHVLMTKFGKLKMYSAKPEVAVGFMNFAASTGSIPWWYTGKPGSVCLHVHECPICGNQAKASGGEDIKYWSRIVWWWTFVFCLYTWKHGVAVLKIFNGW